jgi:lipoate-protein ligase B
MSKEVSPEESTVNSVVTETRPNLVALYLGLMPYQQGLELQRSLAAKRISGALSSDVLLLVQHPHVVTLGRSFKRDHLTASEELLEARGVETFQVERGGDVTYHGPGQLVGYPIIDLKQHRRDLHWYLRQVEESLIVALATIGIHGTRRPGLTGVWVADPANDQPTPPTESERGMTQPSLARKIASIGVHARDWVTWHGFALNVTTDLSFFELMVPCGIDGVKMTSIAVERPGLALEMGETAEVVAHAFGEVFCPQNGPVTLRHDLGALDAI